MRLLPLLALLGCTQPLTDLPNEPGGNPLVPHVAMYPFPSSFYLADDATSATGYRLALDDRALPEDLSSSTWAEADGFSRAPAILAHLRGGFDSASLPDAEDPATTLEVDSPLLLVRVDTLEAVPVLAEVDRQTDNVDRQALILRPRQALAPDADYVVVLRDSLRGASGEPHRPTDAFRALRDGIPTDSDAVEAQRDDFAAVHAVLEGLALEPETVVLAWPFHTRSREQLSTPLLGMHDAMMQAPLEGWTPVTDRVDGDNRLIEGRFEVPTFLDADQQLVLDEQGLPVAQGDREVTFLLAVPETVQGPRPVILFGHGFFSRRDEITWSSFNDSLQAWEMSAAAIDFVGFDEDSAVSTASAIGGDLSALDAVIDQQLQNQATFTALARVVREHLADDVVEDRGDGAFHPLDAGAVQYLGISNGGSQGLPILAASPAIDKGVLVVPGGGWTHMLQRAVQWNTLGFVLEDRYSNPLELQLVMSIMQLTFDPVDALSHADRLTGPTYAGRDPVQVTLHEAVGDAQVNNLVTHWVARSADMPLVSPSPLDVWGLEPLDASPPGVDAPASLFVYDEGYPPLPEGNVPPETDNGAHETIRKLPTYREQVGAFLEDGTVVQVCDGACDPD